MGASREKRLKQDHRRKSKGEDSTRSARQQRKVRGKEASRKKGKEHGKITRMWGRSTSIDREVMGEDQKRRGCELRVDAKRKNKP